MPGTRRAGSFLPRHLDQQAHRLVGAPRRHDHGASFGLPVCGGGLAPGLGCGSASVGAPQPGWECGASSDRGPGSHFGCDAVGCGCGCGCCGDGLLFGRDRGCG